MRLEEIKKEASSTVQNKKKEEIKVQNNKKHEA